METCPRCGHEQVATTRCKRCGARMEVTAPLSTETTPMSITVAHTVETDLVCPKCGREATGDRCRHCGAKTVERERRRAPASGSSHSSSTTRPRHRQRRPGTVGAPRWLLIVVAVVLVVVGAEIVWFFFPGVVDGALSAAGLRTPSFASGTPTEWTDLRGDECFVFGAETGADERVAVVPCDGRYEARAVALIELLPQSDEPEVEALAACETGVGDLPPAAELAVFTPNPDAWEAGERTVLCYLDFPDGTKGA